MDIILYAFICQPSGGEHPFSQDLVIQPLGQASWTNDSGDWLLPPGDNKDQNHLGRHPACEMGQTSLSWDQCMSAAGGPIFIFFTVIFVFSFLNFLK